MRQRAKKIQVGWAALVVLVPFFIFAGRQLPYIGNANGLDTANVSGALRATRSLIVRDTFTYKPGDFAQYIRNSSKLAYMDSAARAFFPEVLVATTTRTGEKLVVNGTADVNGWKFGTPNNMLIPNNSLYADTSRHIAWYVSSYFGGVPAYVKTFFASSGTNPGWVCNVYKQGTTDVRMVFDRNGLTVPSLVLSTSFVTPSIQMEVNSATAELSEKFTRIGTVSLGAAGFATSSTKYQINMGGSSTLATGTERFCITRDSGWVGFSTPSPTAKVDITGNTGYNQLRLRTSYTPTATADANGSTGGIVWDDNYIYIKTSAGWKRAALSTF